MHRRLRRILFALSAILAVVPRAQAASDKDLEPYLQAFYESALWDDGRWPAVIRKWAQPLRVRMTGPMSSTYAEMVVERLRELTSIAGIELKVLPADARDENFLVEFVETSQLYASGRAAGCISSWRTTDNRLTRAQLTINLAQTFGLRRCITHESMHAMGFPGHPHGSDSVLSYVYHREDLSAVDKMSLRILYDERLKPGLPQLPGMAAARDVLVDKMVADGAGEEVRGFGRTFVQNLVPLTIKLAKDGNVGLQYQLGLAYTFGQVVDKDEPAGLGWFKQAAQATQAADPRSRLWATDALFMVGYGLMQGRGAATDSSESIRWYLQAAERGHVGAQNNNGWAYQHGQGIAADPVEAYKWYALAADKKYKLAETNLANLVVTLTAEQVATGRQQVAQWKPLAN